MSFPPRLLDDIRARLTLSEVIGGRVKLMRAGREFKGLCPFHREKSPSFYVNDDKQFYHCFGCGAHGDVIGFAMRHDNLSFPDAVRDLAARAGLPVPETTREEIHAASITKDALALMETTTKWFADQLYAPKNRDVLAYLEGRGLTPETMANFRLGYAPDDERALVAHLTASGYTPDLMTQMGLIKIRDRDQSAYAFFRDRVMFPVMDRSGRVIAFGGRAMPEHMRPPTRGDYKPSKYLNSPETPLFHKGRTVYAIAHARTAAAAGDPIIVVEGYMDAIACHQAGLRGVVAPLGTALTDEQITLLWRLMPSHEKIIHLCFDGDDAGRRAAWRAAERMMPLLKPDHSARIAFLPDGEDPDTLILAKGRAGMMNVIDGGIPLADYIWQNLVGTRRLENPEDRAGLEAQLDEWTTKIVDPKTKYHYHNYFKRRLRERLYPGASRESGGADQWTPSGGHRQTVGRAAFGAPRIKVASRPKMAGTRGVDVLLATLLLHPSIFAQVDENIGLIDIDDPERDALRQDLIAELSTWPQLDEPEGKGFLDQFKNKFPQHTDIIKFLMSDATMVHAGFARAGNDPEVVLAGWHDIFAHLHRTKQAAWKIP